MGHLRRGRGRRRRCPGTPADAARSHAWYKVSRDNPGRHPKHRAHGRAASRLGWRFAIDIARDIAIVILAIFNIVQAIVLTALFAVIFILIRKVLQLWPKIEAIIDKVSDTTGTVADTTHTVSATTSYVTGNVVAPLIKFIAFIAGVRQALVVLLSGPKVPETDDRGRPQ
jgi:hypothetical protein